MISLYVPERFIDHYRARSTEAEITILKRNSKGCLITGEESALRALLDDAINFSDCVSWQGDTSLLGIQSSARSTVKRIREELAKKVLCRFL